MKWLPVLPVRYFLFMHNRCCFSRKIDPGLSQQAELLKIMIKIFCTKAQSQFYKHRITGIHNPLGECLCPVSRCLVTADPAILHDFISRTVKGIVHSHHALFQCRSCSNDLKCRTWCCCLLGCFIEKRTGFICR